MRELGEPRRKLKRRCWVKVERQCCRVCSVHTRCLHLEQQGYLKGLTSGWELNSVVLLIAGNEIESEHPPLALERRKCSLVNGGFQGGVRKHVLDASKTAVAQHSQWSKRLFQSFSLSMCSPRPFLCARTMLWMYVDGKVGVVVKFEHGESAFCAGITGSRN